MTSICTSISTVWIPRSPPASSTNPVPGGLSLHDLEEATQAVADRFRIRAAALTTYNLELDEDEKTLRAGLRIIELLADYASDGKQTGLALDM